MPDIGSCADWPAAETGTIALSAYPNPFEGNGITVKLRSKFTQTVNLEVFDMSGRRLDQRDLALQAGLNLPLLNANRWPPGVYLLRISNAEGELVSRRLVKY